jgi:transposase
LASRAIPAAAARTTGYLSRPCCGSPESALAGTTASFAHWNIVFTRFRDWVKADIWKRLSDAVPDDPDMEYAMVDVTIVKVHRHGQGARGGLKARRSAVRRAA